VALLVAGVAAWAVAIIQPWKAQPADPGLVAGGGPPAPGHVRAAALESVAPVLEWTVTEPRPLTRNPFRADWGPDAGVGWPAAGAVVGQGVAAEGGDTVARQVADAVRGLRLKATVASPAGERWAVINGKTCHEGDEVAGLTLVEILEDRVRLRRQGVTCVLRMD
jgi:hypothetical protein